MVVLVYSAQTLGKSTRLCLPLICLSAFFSQHVMKPADLFWQRSLGSMFVSAALMRQCLPMAVLIQCHAFEY